MSNFPRPQDFPALLKNLQDRLYRIERRTSSTVSPAGPNMIANGSFENVGGGGAPLQWDTFWRTNNPTVSSTTTAYDGLRAASVTSTAATDVQRLYSEVFPITRNVMYAWAIAVRKTAGSGTVNVDVQLTYGNGPALLPFGANIKGSTQLVGPVNVATAGAYTVYSGVAIVTEATSTMATLTVVLTFSATGQTVLVDAASFQSMPGAAMDVTTPKPLSARIRSATQSIPGGGGNTVVDFNVVQREESMPPYTNRTWTLPLTGRYYVGAQVQWAASSAATHNRWLYIFRNGTAYRHSVLPGVNANQAQVVSAILYANAGDEVQIVAAQGSTAAVNIQGSTGGYTSADVTYLGA